MQSMIFAIIMMASAVFFFFSFIPLVEMLFEQYLLGIIYNDGIEITYLLDNSTALKETNYYTNWAIDVFKNTPSEARYWFNPLLSISIPALIAGFLLAFLIASLLPQSTGLIRQKIEREIASLIDEICLNIHGFHSDIERQNIHLDLLNADLRDLHDYEKDWNMSLSDLKVLNKALRWREAGLLYRIFHLNDGISVYLRFYVTVNYSNLILGLVYIGAALLIIIIGLRGLKFIPANEPSLVIFALGLEFTLLLLYAFNLIYSKAETETSTSSSNNKGSISVPELGKSKEVEKMLKLFVREYKDKE